MTYTGTHGHRRGRRQTRTYNAWMAMRARCENPSTDRYDRYGGRGIRVCPQWSKFENFLADMGPAPSSEHSIDRKDTEGHYEPGNCRWATEEEQANNRSTNRVVEFNGERLTVAQWARKLGMDYGKLQHRLDLGWSLDRALDPRAKSKRGAKPKLTKPALEKICPDCLESFTTTSSKKRFCSETCCRRYSKREFHHRNADRINAARRAKRGAA